MTVTATETILREALIDAITTEFEEESLEVRGDRLNESLGQSAPIAGVWPGATRQNLTRSIVAEPTVYVQLFRQWDAKLDPTQAVDPAGIEEWVERTRRCLQPEIDVGEAGLWYFQVTSVDYPPDPTGNISRAVLTVVGVAQNPAIVETTG